MLVIAPNEMFLSYVKDTLPSLGIQNIQQKSLSQFVSDVLGNIKFIQPYQKIAEILDEKRDKHKEQLASRYKGSLILKISSINI